MVQVVWWMVSRAGASALVVLVMAGCTRLPDSYAYLQEKTESVPQQGNFTICHGYDCTFRTVVALDQAEWGRVREVFDPAPLSAAEERAAISRSIALLERIVGARLGTDKDIGGIAFKRAGDRTQLDCIDESTNTTTYLVMLAGDDLLRFHAVARPASRGVFLDFRWYHQSAVIAEIGTGTEYVVDSWVEANGEPPLITTLGHWQTSYGRPEVEG